MVKFSVFDGLTRTIYKSQFANRQYLPKINALCCVDGKSGSPRAASVYPPWYRSPLWKSVRARASSEWLAGWLLLRADGWQKYDGRYAEKPPW